MTLFKQYLSRTVVNAVLLVAVVFIGLLVFINFVTQLNQVGQGSYGVWQACLYVLLSLPLQVYILFPMVGLIGCLIGLGSLASHNELMVMRVSGVSKPKIVRIVMLTVFAIMLIVSILGETVGPYLNAVADRTQTLAQNAGQSLSIGNSVWLRQGNRFIYVDQVLANNVLKGVTIYQFNDHNQLIQNSYAKSATFTSGHWVLHNVAESHISNKQVTALHEASKPWAVTIAPSTFAMSVEDPDDMSLPALWRYIKAREHNGLKAPQYQINFWQRIYQPLAVLVMMFLAIPFVFGSLRDMTIGFRVLVGVIVGFLFYILNNFMGQLSAVTDISPAISTALPIVVFALVGLLLVRLKA